MCKIEKVVFLCKINGKFASVDALTPHKSYMSLFNNNKKKLRYYLLYY